MFGGYHNLRNHPYIYIFITIGHLLHHLRLYLIPGIIWSRSNSSTNSRRMFSQQFPPSTTLFCSFPHWSSIVSSLNLSVRKGKKQLIRIYETNVSGNSVWVVLRTLMVLKMFTPATLHSTCVSRVFFPHCFCWLSLSVKPVVLTCLKEGSCAARPNIPINRKILRSLPIGHENPRRLSENLQQPPRVDSTTVIPNFNQW